MVELELDVDLPDDFEVPAEGVVNTARVTSATADPNAADNQSSFTAGGPPSADVSVRKIPPAEQPVAGGNASYVLEIVNFGPSAAPALVITDVLPPGTSFVRYFDPTGADVPPGLCESDGADPATVTCDFGQFTDPIGGFPAFVGTRIGIEIAIDATTANGTLLENTATISADLPDPNEGNNTSTAVVSVRTEVNLRIEKLVVEMDAGGDIVGEVPEDADPLGVPPGHAVSFGLVVTNDGPSAASDVQIIDAVPWIGGNFPVGDCDFLTGDIVCNKPGGPLGPGEQFGIQLITLPGPRHTSGRLHQHGPGDHVVDRDQPGRQLRQPDRGDRRPGRGPDRRQAGPDRPAGGRRHVLVPDRRPCRSDLHRGPGAAAQLQRRGRGGDRCAAGRSGGDRHHVLAR